MRSCVCSSEYDGVQLSIVTCHHTMGIYFRPTAVCISFPSRALPNNSYTKPRRSQACSTARTRNITTPRTLPNSARVSEMQPVAAQVDGLGRVRCNRNIPGTPQHKTPLVLSHAILHQPLPLPSCDALPLRVVRGEGAGLALRGRGVLEEVGDAGSGGGLRKRSRILRWR
jgi:hypothetical protein